MHSDFKIKQGIYLVQPPYELDLHNAFDFLGLDYSVEDKTLTMRWRRSQAQWIAQGTPASVHLEFGDVSEFRFQPRDAEIPFTEDSRLSAFGYWTDEDWADGLIEVGPDQTPDPKWLTAISFASGAVIAFRAASAYARIVA